jgi:predicted alpha/beta superfamily hydrolase
MQDGQNLFDDATSYSGEWHIDETLNKLHAQGDYGAIVVGIDNGGTDRINEYSPWKNLQYGGGEGDQYVDFIAKTLKPFIDENYRTNPKASQNALIGSSLGALISTYGAVKYSDTFGKVGNLSPAYWFVLKDLNNYILSHPKKLKKLKMYFVAGQNESSTLVSDIATVKENLIKKGVKPAHTFVKIDPDGVHNESYWSKEFAALYLWLFPQK